MSDVDDFQRSADLMGKVPITLFLKRGTFALRGGRLSFVLRKGTVVFDAPVGEFHSLAKTLSGLRISHGATQYKVVIGNKTRASTGSHNPIVAGAAAAVAIDDYRDAKQDAEYLVAVLTPLVGAAPA